MSEKLLTVEQVATRLTVHPNTVRRWLKDGRLSGTMLGGTKMGWRIAEADLQRFVESGRPAKIEKPD